MRVRQSRRETPIPEFRVREVSRRPRLIVHGDMNTTKKILIGSTSETARCRDSALRVGESGISLGGGQSVGSSEEMPRWERTVSSDLQLQLAGRRWCRVCEQWALPVYRQVPVPAAEPRPIEQVQHDIAVVVTCSVCGTQITDETDMSQT